VSEAVVPTVTEAADAVASTGPFESVDQVIETLREQGYIADTRLATTVFLLTRLDKPLLLEGPAGVGKT
jgi:MoxR-like ATPase